MIQGSNGIIRFGYWSRKNTPRNFELLKRLWNEARLDDRTVASHCWLEIASTGGTCPHTSNPSARHQDYSKSHWIEGKIYAIAQEIIET